MAFGTNHGPVKKSASANRDGERKYEITYLVEMTSATDGPLLAVGGLIVDLGVTVGTSTLSINGDVDSYAYLTHGYKTERHATGSEKGYYWKVTLFYETVTREGQDRDPTNPVENPLNDPVKISGTFSKGTVKVCKDASNATIKNTSHDPIYVDKDESRPTVRIEKNVTTLPLSSITNLINNVNSVSMWGLSARKIKFSSASWTRKYWGTTVYYTLVYEFEINTNTFDRTDIPDRNNKHIRGEFDKDNNFTAKPGMDVANPEDFEPWVNARGRYKDGWLNTSTGVPSNTENYLSTVELYDETDLETNLGLPSSL